MNLALAYDELGRYTCNDESEYPAIIEALKRELKDDPDSLIDYMDEITVWEKVEYAFTVKEFCEMLGIEN